MNNHSKQLGPILKQARKECRMTQEELAARANITSRYVCAIENEGQEPSFEVLTSIIHALHISADRIFYPNTIPVSPERTRLNYILDSCSEKNLRVLLQTAQALIDNL